MTLILFFILLIFLYDLFSTFNISQSINQAHYYILAVDYHNPTQKLYLKSYSQKYDTGQKEEWTGKKERT